MPKLFDTVYLPESVKHEVLPGKVARGEDAIAHAIDSDWLKVWTEPIKSRLDFDLDAGEIDGINLAMNYTEQALLVWMNVPDVLWQWKKDYP